MGNLVFAVGFSAGNGVPEPIERSGLPFCVIGDQKAPRRIKDAIAEGHRVVTEWMVQWK